ncbi:MAG: TorF family putative porin, partial [Phenylobacterium sp.]
MKILKLSLLAAAATLAVGSAAHAEDAKPFAVTFNVGAATDYVFRGVSQTDSNAQFFAGADATIGSMGYAGVWVSNVDFGNDTSAEYDLYGGFKPTLGPVALDLGVIYYGYANKPDGPDEAYWEGKIAGSVPAGPATLGAAVYYSPEFFGETGAATYYEVNGSVPIPNSKFSVSGAVGHQAIDAGGDYSTWNLGVGWAVTDHFGFDLRY